MLDKIEEAEGIERGDWCSATMTKLKQVCNHPAQFLGDGSRVAGRSGKLARLEEMLEEVLADGRQGAVLHAVHRVRRACSCRTWPRASAPRCCSCTAARPRPRATRWSSASRPTSGPPLFLLSLKAGGTGLNLTAANHVFHLDRWWNPAVEDQATDRAFRIGQRRNVQVHKFVCIGTLEEQIDAMIEEQARRWPQLVVGAGENWLTELSTAQLRDLLDAVRGGHR